MNDLEGLSYGFEVWIIDLQSCQPRPSVKLLNTVGKFYVTPTMFSETLFLGDLLPGTSPFDKTTQLLELHTSFVGFLFTPGSPTLLKQSRNFNLQIFQMRKAKAFRFR